MLARVCRFRSGTALLLGTAEMKIMRYLASPGHPGVMTISHILEDTSNYYCVMPFFTGTRVCVRARSPGAPTRALCVSVRPLCTRAWSCHWRFVFVRVSRAALAEARACLTHSALDLFSLPTWSQTVVDPPWSCWTWCRRAP